MRFIWNTTPKLYEVMNKMDDFDDALRQAIEKQVSNQQVVSNVFIILVR